MSIRTPHARWLRLVAGALLSTPLVTSAQSADPAAPFLGTWSGVFTTQDHEFWGAEDLACFVGCPRSYYDHLAELFADFPVALLVSE